MLKLPDVTLVMVETREHELARMALEDCLRVAEFGAVLVLTDRPSEFWKLTQLGVTPKIVNVPDWPTKLGWSQAWWYDVPPHLTTAYSLNIQWDSWIWKPELWSDEFLKYDVLGAPWWYKDGLNVGNGGFSFVSTALKRYMRDRRWEFPCETPVDDDLLCRKFRPRLEERGFSWAPEKLAHRFAFECCRPSPTSEHFGFHACVNFPDVLDRDRLLERARVMVRSPYITKNDYMWKAFLQKAPWVADELKPPLLMEAELRFQHKSSSELLRANGA